ncbi:MAG: mechanosensitive ion channel family protein [Deltaproteobacteria bacterium]|nr:mechanosensitive ion channel family protein [Deltaproteobacteria bacterium]
MSDHFVFAKAHVRALFVALMLAGPASPGLAQDASEQKPDPPEPTAAVFDEFDRGTPRGTAIGYLTACRAGDYTRAARYLDLRRLDPAERNTLGPKLARELKVVLDRQLWVPVDDLSEDPAGIQGDGLEAHVDRLGRIDGPDGGVEIDLERVSREDGVPIWQVSAATVARVPRLYAEFGYGPLERFLPSVFFEVRVLEVLLWQWVALLFLTFTAWLLAYLAAATTLAVLRPILARTETDLDDRLFDTMLPPLRLFMTIFLFWIGSNSLGLAVPAEAFISAVCRAAVLGAITWLLMRLVNVVGEVVEQRLETRGQETAVPLVAPGRKAVKGVIFLVTFVAMLDNFGFNVTALVAGLGVGGIAVALAAQKSIENLFGGIMLYADRPVRVGDYCGFGGRVGVIEEIGMRSTRIRTLDRTIVTVPNAEFSSLQIENFAERDSIRLSTTLGLRYETTPDQIRHLLVELRRLLYAHPMVSNDTARVRFTSFGAFSLDLEIRAYVTTSDWTEFMGIREDLYLQIMDLVAASGTGFAFPSQTLYLGKDDGLDSERGQAAAAEVAAWREQHELFLPDFSDAEIERLQGKHEWPPVGTPGETHDSGYSAKGGDET